MHLHLLDSLLFHWEAVRSKDYFLDLDKLLKFPKVTQYTNKLACLRQLFCPGVIINSIPCPLKVFVWMVNHMVISSTEKGERLACMYQLWGSCRVLVYEGVVFSEVRREIKRGNS